MKKFKPFCILLFILILASTIVSADTVNVGHNTTFSLQYGSGSTMCTDTSSGHSYWTSGNASNTNARLTVYVLNQFGKVVDSDSSRSYSTYASAWWTRGSTTTHGHKASSVLISY